jgi:hypothetical protein
MKSFSRGFVALSCAMVLSSCATEIINTIDTTVPAESTTSTIATPTGDIEELLAQLDSAISGLGQKIVDGDSAAYKATYAQSLAIWDVLKPQVEASGVIGLDEDVRRIVELVRTATERKRPADADKAARFLSLMRESLPGLLAD